MPEKQICKNCKKPKGEHYDGIWCNVNSEPNDIRAFEPAPKSEELTGDRAMLEAEKRLELTALKNELEFRNLIKNAKIDQSN